MKLSYEARDVLDYYDGPLLVRFRDEKDRRYFGIIVDSDRERYVMCLVQISRARLRDVESGRESLRLVFKDAREYWLYDLYSKTLEHKDKRVPTDLQPGSRYFLRLDAASRSL